jgi:hypothetical protein
MGIASWRFYYRIADCVFAVEGIDSKLQNLAENLYSAAQIHTGDPSTCFALERRQNLFILQRDGVEICRTSSLATFFQEVEWALTETAMASLGHFYQVHAGVVADDDRARLLIGPSDAGKTSLVLAFAVRGAAIFTDEVALIDPDGLQVVPFRRDLIVHQGSQHLLPEAVKTANPAHFKNFGKYRYVSPLDIDCRELRDKTAVAQLVFPVLCPGSETILQPLGQAEAAKLIILQSFNLERWGARGTDLTGQLVETCPAVKVTFADARQAAARLIDLEIQF